MGAQLFLAGQFDVLAFGGNGMRVIRSGEQSIADEVFGCIQIVTGSEDTDGLWAVISFTNDLTQGDSNVTEIYISAGTLIYGNFIDVVVTEGAVICYLK